MSKLFSNLDKERQLAFILQHELQQDAYNYLKNLTLVNKWIRTIDYRLSSIGSIEEDNKASIKKAFSPKQIEIFIRLRNELLLPFIMNNVDLNEYKSMYNSYIKDSANFICFIDNNYPTRLKTIEDSPLSFFKKGGPIDFRKSVAIVGRRKASDLAKNVAFQLGYKLAELGFTVISGMAEGIDTKGHEGCLRAEGETIAVFGTPINIIYPKMNANLAKNIFNHGVAISERSFEKSYKHGSAFINRNRIISALSNAVIVVESNEKGGSLHQIKFALTQKRDVYYYLPPNGDQRIIAMKVLRKFPSLMHFEDPDELVRLIQSKISNVNKARTDIIRQSEQETLIEYFEI